MCAYAFLYHEFCNAHVAWNRSLSRTFVRCDPDTVFARWQDLFWVIWSDKENPYSMISWALMVYRKSLNSMISWALMVYFNRNYMQHRHHVKPWYQLWRTAESYKDRSFWRALSVDDLGRYWAWETSICHGPSITRI